MAQKNIYGELNRLSGLVFISQASLARSYFAFLGMTGVFPLFLVHRVVLES